MGGGFLQRMKPRRVQTAARREKKSGSREPRTGGRSTGAVAVAQRGRTLRLRSLRRPAAAKADLIISE
jgi:hypothetical protein